MSRNQSSGPAAGDRQTASPALSALRMGAPALVLALLGALPTTGAAQSGSFGAQIRPRFEHRTPVTAQPGRESYLSTRTRVQLQGNLSERLGASIQLQDLRAWGDFPGTIPNEGRGRVDLHQGYLEAGAWNKDLLSVRAGRQEMAFGESRLVGAGDWSQLGRAFDGVRTRTRLGAARVDLFGFRVDNQRAVKNPDTRTFFGSYATLGAGVQRTLDLYGFYNHVGPAAPTVAATDQGTMGARLVQEGRVAYRIEAAYQFGKRGGRDVGAYLLSGRVGTTLAENKVDLTLWYDYLSGSAAPAQGKVRVFDTLYGSNHGFYGTADLFTNIPSHTGGRGLQNLMLRSSYKVSATASIGADLHTFRLARAGTLPSAHLGEELDLTGRWRLSSKLEVIGGLSHIVGDDAMHTLGRLDKKDRKQTFSFMQLVTTF